MKFSVLIVCFFAQSTAFALGINLHVIKRNSLDPLLYSAVNNVQTETLTSRIDASFNSIINAKKKSETYAVDHCYNPGDESLKENLMLLKHRFVKEPSACDCDPTRDPACDDWDFKQIITALRGKPTYFRVAQHFEKKSREMIQIDGKYKVHSELKYGDPIVGKKRKERIRFKPHLKTKNVASRINRWLSQACNADYFGKKTSMKAFPKNKYWDDLFSTRCNTGIMEVAIKRDDIFHPGLLFFEHESNYALLMEVQPNNERIETHSAVASPPVVETMESELKYQTLPRSFRSRFSTKLGKF